MARPKKAKRASTEPRPPPVDRTARAMAGVALAVSLVALVLAGWALHAQQTSEERLREVGRELQRALTPRALPMEGPPLELDPDDT